MSVPILIGSPVGSIASASGGSGVAVGGTDVAVGASGTGVGVGSSELHATATNAIEAKAKTTIDDRDIEAPNN